MVMTKATKPIVFRLGRIFELSIDTFMKVKHGQYKIMFYFRDTLNNISIIPLGLFKNYNKTPFSRFPVKVFYF